MTTSVYVGWIYGCTEIKKEISPRRLDEILAGTSSDRQCRYSFYRYVTNGD